MKLSELAQYVEKCAATSRDDLEVVVCIKLPYATVGSRPTVPVTSVQAGFDWDRGKFIITPKEDLTPADRDFATQMKEMQSKLDYSLCENLRLKAENKKLKESK